MEKTSSRAASWSDRYGDDGPRPTRSESLDGEAVITPFLPSFTGLPQLQHAIYCLQDSITAFRRRGGAQLSPDEPGRATGGTAVAHPPPSV